MRRPRRADDRQGMFGWAAPDEANPAEASHYERPAPRAVADPVAEAVPAEPELGAFVSPPRKPSVGVRRERRRFLPGEGRSGGGSGQGGAPDADKKRMPKRTTALLISAILCLGALGSAPAHAAVPAWVDPAVDMLVANASITRRQFKPNSAMSRRTFKRIMRKTFGGGYTREEGKVTAGPG